MPRARCIWATRIQHIGNSWPHEDRLPPSALSAFRLCANFELSDEMLRRLSEQVWIHTVVRVRGQRRLADLIVRWREVPYDYSAVNTLVIYILQTMEGR